jgi:hypothetical protein
VISCSFHPEAETELVEAALFYDSRVEGLGRLFAAEVHRIISYLRAFPDAGAPMHSAARRALVDRFPYAVVYQHGGGGIRVLAIAHLSRRPGYWRRRK